MLPMILVMITFRARGRWPQLKRRRGLRQISTNGANQYNSVQTVRCKSVQVSTNNALNRTMPQSAHLHNGHWPSAELLINSRCSIACCPVSETDSRTNTEDHLAAAVVLVMGSWETQVLGDPGHQCQWRGQCQSLDVQTLQFLDLPGTRSVIIYKWDIEANK